MRLGKMKVAQMRKELQDRDLDISGTRPSLMKRLREALQKEEHMKSQQIPIPNQVEYSRVAQYPEHPVAEHPVAEQEPKQREPTMVQQKTHEQGPVSEIVQLHRTGNGEDGEEEREHVPTEAHENASYEDERRREGDVGSTGIGEAGRNVEHDKIATGNLSRLNEMAHEERMRKRRERFGLVESKPAALKKDDAPVVTDEMRKMEELKRRRAIRFGSGGEDSTVSEEERQRRLKRQRRFQSAGNAAAM